jgi:hypothetical protein
MVDRPGRVDLHCHPFEAMGVPSPTKINTDHLRRIEEQALVAGLDAVAITEHGGWAWGITAVEVASRLDLSVIVLAGQEDWCYPVEIVELLLPSGGIFRFLAHPGAPGPFDDVFDLISPAIHGIEVVNKNHSWHMDEDALRSLATRHHLLAISSSDAHNMNEIGQQFTQSSVAQLEETIAAKSVQEFVLIEALRK